MRKEIITCDGCGKTEVYDIMKTSVPRDCYWNMSENDLCRSCRHDFQDAGWTALKNKRENKEKQI